MLLSLLSQEVCTARPPQNGKCHLRGRCLVVPILRNMAGKEVLGMPHQQRCGLKMGVGMACPITLQEPSVAA